MIKDKVIEYFSNNELFQIFKKNKRILLELINLEIIKIDESIASIITNDEYKKANYLVYFYPEIDGFIKNTIKEKLPLDFEDKRKIGENDDNICQIIRNDSIEEFKSQINPQIFQTKIKTSIYEKNKYLIQNPPTIIEYAAFFGSLKILKYCVEKGVNLKPSIFIYAIHSCNIEVIYWLETIINEDEDFLLRCLKESIKCHFFESTAYYKIIMKRDKMNYYIENNYYDNPIAYCLHYHYYDSLNSFFLFIDKYKNSIYYFIEYDYVILVKSYLKYKNVDTKTMVRFALKKGNKYIADVISPEEKMQIEKSNNIINLENSSVYELENTIVYGHMHYTVDGRCWICGLYICEFQGKHHLDFDTKTCSYCKKPWCQVGHSHNFGQEDSCIYCHKPRCEITGEGHDFGCNGRCKKCNIPSCEINENHHLSLDTKTCTICNQLWCNIGHPHSYGDKNLCRYCHKPRCEITGEGHDFGCNGRCKKCNIPSCEINENHHLSLDTKTCTICNQPWCNIGHPHSYGDKNLCIYCHKSICELEDKGHRFKDGKCQVCGILYCKAFNTHLISIKTLKCKFCGETMGFIGSNANFLYYT